MTDMTPHGRESLEHWLADRHRDFRDGLSQFLDPDAGLREATTLHAGHVGLLRALDSRVDTGRPGSHPASTGSHPASTGSGPVQSERARRDHSHRSRRPAARIALRRHPAIMAVILSDLTIRALTIAIEIPVNRARERAVAVALDRASALGRDLDLAGDRARALEFDLRSRGRDHDHDVALGLAQHIDFARGYTSHIAEALASARGLHHPLDRARGLSLGRARESSFSLAGSLTYTLSKAVDLARDPGLGIDIDRNTVLDVWAGWGSGPEIPRSELTMALNSTRDLARQAALAVGRALGIGQPEGLAATLLDGALDDFTHADLAHTDLSGHDLTGVRWSDWGTTWPPGTDVDALRARSREEGTGTGVFVITSQGGIDETLRRART